MQQRENLCAAMPLTGRILAGAMSKGLYLNDRVNNLPGLEIRWCIEGGCGVMRADTESLAAADIVHGYPPVPRPADFAGRRILMLQGPFGPFFRRLARDLRRAGAIVHKVNFNGGDWLFYPLADLTYTGTLEDWPGVFADLVEKWNIDAVFLYADNRPVHEAAIRVCEQRGIEYFSFEEGYWRPHHVTLERGRTNAASRLPRDEIFLQRLLPLLEKDPRIPPPHQLTPRTSFAQKAWVALYHTMACLLQPLMPARTYHRGIGAQEMPAQLRSFWRYWKYRFMERGIQERLVQEARSGRPLFLVPLQVPLDSQVRCHSGFPCVTTFIRTVLESFAAHAPHNAWLIFKQHPQDRGYNCYRDLIEKLARQLDVADRVLYIHDQHLPTLLQHAAGVIVINSTVGFSALIHNRPVKALGNAIYDLPGLTAQMSLEEFWKNPQAARPDMKRLGLFWNWMVRCTQINGSFYRRMPDSVHHCGLVWQED